MKPLRILVHSALWDCPEIKKLRETKGDVVTQIAGEDPLQAFDVILGPNCWRITPALTKYVSLALKAARKAQRGEHPAV